MRKTCRVILECKDSIMFGMCLKVVLYLGDGLYTTQEGYIRIALRSRGQICAFCVVLGINH
jgi:hypothetical protein